MIPTVPHAAAVRQKQKPLLKRIADHRAQYAMMAATIIMVVVFGIFPILYVLYYSFTEYNGFTPATFNGLDNYIRVFQDGSFWTTVLNTLQLGIGIPLVQLPIALLLAVLLNKKFPGVNFSRAVIFVPNITSTAIMAIIFFFMFASYNGIVNDILQNLHLIDSPIEWFGSGFMAKVVIILFCTWSGVGFYMVLFLSAIQSIPADVYESAKIDGANSVQTFFKITIPMMGKMFQIITSLSILNALKLFDSVKALTNGGPGNSTEVMTMYIFRYFFESMGNAQQGYASAVSIVSTLMVSIITLLYMFFTRKMNY
ncbi:MAG: binding-protein-dependent transport system inner rane component [Paenibacillaceae bacterium]|jgi:raffinose/stachyose/melibiose transport system permease protein|nr:binding-protein-dependent transport system inner rane component [Paenibacillaceae bacterium]